MGRRGCWSPWWWPARSLPPWSTWHSPAATVQCVPDRELPAANALVTGAENALWIAGPGILGALILLGLGPTGVTAVASLLLAGAALCAYAAPLPHPAAASTSALTTPLAGVLLVLRDCRVRRPMLVAILSNLLYGYLVVHLVRAAAGEVVARLFGVYDQLNVGAIALGSMLAGPLSAGLGVGPALVVLAVARLVTVLAAFVRPYAGRCSLRVA